MQARFAYRFLDGVPKLKNVSEIGHTIRNKINDEKQNYLY